MNGKSLNYIMVILQHRLNQGMLSYWWKAPNIFFKGGNMCWNKVNQVSSSSSSFQMPTPLFMLCHLSDCMIFHYSCLNYSSRQTKPILFYSCTHEWKQSYYGICIIHSNGHTIFHFMSHITLLTVWNITIFFSGCSSRQTEPSNKKLSEGSKYHSQRCNHVWEQG